MKFSGAIGDVETALYVTAGNAIIGLIVVPMQSISTDLAWARQRNDFDFFATLPFSKLQLVLGFAAVSTIFTLPGMIIVLLIGKLWLKFPIVFHPLIFVVMLVSGFSLIGLGVLYGVYAKNGHHANMLNTITMMIVTFFSPVIIPKENLPMIFKYTSKLFPTSYAADAFRATLRGMIDGTFLVNLLILILFTLTIMYFAVKKLDWRIE